jgi:hypothetical protein
MFTRKLKFGFLCLLVLGAAGAGVGGVTYRTLASDPPSAQAVRRQAPREDADGQGKKESAPNKGAEKNQADQILDMVLKGMKAYQESRGGDPSRGGERPRGKAQDPNVEAFLKAFEISSVIARAKRPARENVREAPESLDSAGVAFRQAYELARALKKTLEREKASDARRGEKLLEALDLFLKEGKGFDQTIRRRAKDLAVEHATREIANALSRVEKAGHDRQTELDVLDEIERAVQGMRKRVQQRQDRR